MGDDLLHGQVPRVVDHVGEAQLGDGDVPALDLRRDRVVGEELHVDGVGVVNGDHALAVVVEVFPDDLQQSLYGAASTKVVISCRGAVAHGSRGNQPTAQGAQVLVLLLELGKCDGQATDDTLVRQLVCGGQAGVDDEAKVEDELVAVVFWVEDGYWKPQDAALAVRVPHRHVPVKKGLARDDVLLQHVKVEERCLCGSLRRDDAAGRTLGDDFGT